MPPKKAAPASELPRTTATSSGVKASPTSCARSSENLGVNSDGLAIARLPAARIPANGPKTSVSG